MGIFSVAQCVGVIQLVSGFLSEGIGPYVAVYLVYLWEEGKSGTFYVIILVMSPWFLSFTLKAIHTQWWLIR